MGTQRTRHGAIDLASLVHLDTVPALEGPLRHAVPSSRTTKQPKLRPTAVTPTQQRRQRNDDEEGEEVLVYDKNMYRDDDSSNDSGSDVRTADTSEGMTRSSNNSSIAQVHTTPTSKSAGQHANTIQGVKKSDRVSARRLFTALCTCYWAAFGEAEMSIVPDAHATHCPCRWQTDDYDSISAGVCTNNKLMRIEHNGIDERDTIDLSSDTSSSSSTSCVRHTVARHGRGEAHRHASIDKQHEDRGRKDDKPHRKRHHHKTANMSSSPHIHLDANVLQVSTRKTTETRSPAARRGVSIGRAPRMPTAKSCSPGPGAYEVAAACDALGTTTTHESAPRTVRSVFVSCSARSLPYDKTTISKTTESEETEERGKTTRVVSPGPASYDISRAFQAEARHVSPPAYHFSRAPRITTTITSTHHGAEEPGPASYDIQAVTDMAAAIMQARHKNNKRHSSSLTRTSSARETQLAVRDNGVPGPRTYDIAPRPHSCTQPQHSTSPHDNDAGGQSKKMIMGTTFGTAERAVCSTTPAPLDASEVQTRRSSTPGPGAYDVAAATLHEARTSRAPQWSMGTSGRETRPGFLIQSNTREEEAARMPGPGQYLPIFTSDDIAHTNNNVALKEGSARRRAMGTFGTASRGLLPETAPPSPRYLHLRDDDDGEGYSSAHGGERDVSPGPGAYDVTRSASADAARHAVRMRTAPRLTWIEQLIREPQGLPGPASYDVKDDLVRHRTSGPVMGTATATREGMIEGYDRNSAEVPGPGAYDVALSSINEIQRRGAVIGTATRGLRWTQNGDGAALTFHAALSEEKDNVGPGSYSLPALPRGAAFTIAGKSTTRDAMIHTDEESAALSPGPGAYSPQLSLVRPQPARVVLHSTSPRFAHELHSEKDGAVGGDGVPGPGAYDTVQKERSASAGRSFPTAPRMTWPQNDITGDLHGEGGAEWRANVGPGSYEVERAAASGTTRGVVFAHAPRFTGNEEGNAAVNGTSVPGPGAYDVAGAARHIMNAPAVGFTTAPRELYTDLYGVHEARVQAGATVPGPGAYDPQLQLRYPSARAVMMAQRGSDGERRAGAEIPGPGAYEVSNAASQYVNAPRYGFGSAPRETLPHEAARALAAQTPGPGAYEPQQTSYRSSSGSGDAVRFATAPRVYSHVTYSDTPGPGSYNLQTICDNRTGEGNTLSSAAHAVRFATAPRVLYSDSNLAENATSPGPGAYDPQQQLVLPREPQPSRFGTATRPTSIDIHAMRLQSDEATPGPGQYHTAVDTMSLPGYRGVHLGAAPQSKYTSALHKESSEGPGPGAYNPQDVIQQPHTPALAFPTAPRNSKSTTAHSITNVNMSADTGRDDTPGPGAYDAQDTLLSVHRTAPAVSLGTSARFAFTPPSQYEHEEQVKAIESARERPTINEEGLTRAPAYSFARADRGLMSSHSVAEGPEYVAVWPSRATSHVAAPAEQHQPQMNNNNTTAQRTVQPAPGNDAMAVHARRPEKHVRFLLHDTQSEGSARREASPRVTMRDESPGPGSYDLRSERERRGRQPVRHIEEVRPSIRQSAQPRNEAYNNTTRSVATRRDEPLYTMPYDVAHTEQQQQRRSIEPRAVTAGVEQRYPAHVQQPLPVSSPASYYTPHVLSDVAPQQRDARTLERLIQAGYPVSGQRQAEAALIDAMPL